jgi:hypothetical protein
MARQILPIEVKSGQTISGDHFRNLDYWRQLTRNNAQPSYLVYAGDQSQSRAHSEVISWKDLERIPPV